MSSGRWWKRAGTTVVPCLVGSSTPAGELGYALSDRDCRAALRSTPVTVLRGWCSTRRAIEEPCRARGSCWSCWSREVAHRRMSVSLEACIAPPGGGPVIRDRVRRRPQPPRPSSRRHGRSGAERDWTLPSGSEYLALNLPGCFSMCAMTDLQGVGCEG